MTPPPMHQRFFAELKRRKVFRVAAAYGAGAFVVIQAADVIFPRIPLPDWTVSFVVWLCILGLPVAIIMAWVFERTGEGLRRTEDAPAEEIAAIVAEPAARRWPSGLAALGGVALLAIGAWTAWQVAVPDAAVVAESRLAVLPFGVTGSAGLEWLNDGLATLLSQNLFAPGETETVDAVRVIKSAERSAGKGDGSLDLRAAGKVARDLGAGRFVLGSVQGTGGRVRINAGLYALRDSIHLITRSEVEGDTTALFALVDNLTAQLIGGGQEMGAASADLARTAAHTSESLPALKLYLEGEKHLRSGDMAEARESFRAAVEIDSTFALAMFRNAFAHLLGFENQNDEASEWAERAGRHTDHLSEYDRRTLAAFTSHAAGRIREAERAYRELIAAYPSRLDARVLLTMLLAYYDPLRGRPLDEVAALFGEVREADPGYLCLKCVGYRIFNTQGDVVGSLDDAVATTEALPDSAEAARLLPVVTAMRALARGDSAEWNAARRTLLPTIDRDSASTLSNFVYVALDTGRPALADTLTRVDFAGADFPGTFADVSVVMDFVRGRWQQAYEKIAAKEPKTLFELISQRVVRVPLDAVFPDARQAIARCLAWEGPVGRSAPAEALRSHLRLYGAAMLSLQMGDQAGALSFADSLASLPVEDPLVEPLVRNLLRIVRGEAALRAGDIPAAREQLDALEWEMAPTAYGLSSVFGQPRSYLLRGEAAWRDGDTSEARRWFEGGMTNWHNEDYALIEMRRGEVQEASGNFEQARIHYARVVEALEPADTANAALVRRREEARARLSALLEGGS